MSHSQTGTLPMSRPSPSEESTFTARTKAFIHRRQITAYLIMAYIGMWVSLLPVLLLDAPIRPLTAVGAIFGLALPAFLVTAVTDGEAGVRDLLRRALHWRVAMRWYAIALLALPTIMLLIETAVQGMGPLDALTDEWVRLFTAFAPNVLIALFTVQIFEELGWTGFMQHRLQDRRGPFRASLMVALAFGLIHYPTYFVDTSVTAELFLAVLVQMIPITIFAVFLRSLITWLYNGSGSSVVIVALLHAAFNTPLPTEIIPESHAVWLPLAAVVVIAVPVMVATKGRLAYQST